MRRVVAEWWFAGDWQNVVVLVVATVVVVLVRKWEKLERLGLMGWAGARVARRGVGSCGGGWEMGGLEEGLLWLSGGVWVKSER